MTDSLRDTLRALADEGYCLARFNGDGMSATLLSLWSILDAERTSTDPSPKARVDDWQEAWEIFQAEREKGITSKRAFFHMIQALLPPKESAPSHDGAVGDARKRAVADHCAHSCVYCGTGRRDEKTERVDASGRPSNDRDGACICNYNPETTDGPDECCPFHGRPYSYWIDRGDELQRRLDALAAPEGQPEGSRGGGMLGKMTDPYRGSGPEWAEAEHDECWCHPVVFGHTNLTCPSRPAAPAPVPDDEAVELREARRHRSAILAAGYVSPEAHAAAVREAVRAHGERIAEAIEAQTDAELGCPCQCSREQRDRAARIARAVTREAVGE